MFEIQISLSLHQTFQARNSLFELDDFLFCSSWILPIQKTIGNFIALVRLNEIANYRALTSC